MSRFRSIALHLQVSRKKKLFLRVAFLHDCNITLFGCNERPEYHLPVPVPLETASNMEEVRLYNEKKKAAEAAGEFM